jgi:hypothetical protein
MSSVPPGGPAGGPGAPPSRQMLAAFRNRGFVACAIILVVFVTGFEFLRTYTGINFIKKPVPLKAPLGALRQERIRPYRQIEAYQLSSEVIDQLGTREYVQWLVGESDGTDLQGLGRAMSLFVTYYTGSHDQAPHVPDVCYVASGYKQVGESSDTVAVQTAGGVVEMPLQVRRYRRVTVEGHVNEQLVAYVFHCNGEFMATPGQVRRAVRDPFITHAYFSKLEVGVNLGGYYKTADEAIEGAKRFLQVVTPVLLQDHWPDFDGVVRSAKAGRESRAG